jgi:hypothetical protein
MEFISKKILKAYYNQIDNEIYVVENVDKSGETDTIFLEHERYTYLIMTRAVFDQLDYLIYLGDL